MYNIVIKCNQIIFQALLGYWTFINPISYKRNRNKPRLNENRTNMRCWLLQVNIGSVYSYLFNGSDLFLETTVPSFGGKRLDGHLAKSKVIHSLIPRNISTWGRWVFTFLSVTICVYSSKYLPQFITCKTY